jgi:hypothetical protein
MIQFAAGRICRGGRVNDSPNQLAEEQQSHVDNLMQEATETFDRGRDLYAQYVNLNRINPAPPELRLQLVANLFRIEMRNTKTLFRAT